MSDLIAQLRLMQRDGWSSPGKAADTIESQAMRIAELESELHYATSAGVIECMVRNKAVAERIAELESEVARLRVEVERLAGFVGEIIRRDDGSPYDIDGGDIQDWAVKYGLFREVEATESCGEFCNCEGFPTQCYRYTPLAQAALDAAKEQS